MNGEFTDSGRIIEVKEEKSKKQKPRFSLTTFIVTLIVSIIVSSISGAGGAFFMYTLLTPANVTEETTEKTQFVISEETTAASLNTEETEAETEVPATETTEPYEPPTGIATEPPSEAVTSSPIVYEEPTTQKPSLSKGDIYSTAVNSIFTIKTSWKQYYNSILGSYYRPASSSGTGFSVSTNGYIVTNYHVIEKAEEITVTDYNGKEYSAKVVGSEPENDFAVLKINADTIAAPLGSSSELKVGDDIMVIGNALGELSFTFTDGIVSHLSRDITLSSGLVINTFQTNAAINNGNSGGPVYNMDGEVVGIASAKYASESIEGLGFCIPIDNVKTIMSDIIIYGFVKGKPSLGVSLQTLTATTAARYSLPQGCYVVDLDNISCSYNAGIRKGDVITKIGNKSASSCTVIESFLKKRAAGDTVSITYYREGEYYTVSVVLDEKKPSEPRTDYSNVYDY